MAVTLKWKCDGCDREAETKTGANPGAWNKIRIAVSGFHNPFIGENANGEHSYDLCGHCQWRLRDAISPQSWPRDSLKDGADG